jgi:hypothetical protein
VTVLEHVTQQGLLLNHATAQLRADGLPLRSDLLLGGLVVAGVQRGHPRRIEAHAGGHASEEGVPTTGAGNRAPHAVEHPAGEQHMLGLVLGRALGEESPGGSIEVGAAAGTSRGAT